MWYKVWDVEGGEIFEGEAESIEDAVLSWLELQEVKDDLLVNGFEVWVQSEGCAPTLFQSSPEVEIHLNLEAKMTG